MPLVILDYGDQGDLGTGARRSRHGDQRFQGPLQRPGPAEFHEIVRPLGNHDIDPLGRIHDGTSAHRDHGIAAVFPVKGGQAVHHLEIGIGGNVIGDGADLQSISHRLPDDLHEARPGNTLVGDQQGPPGADVAKQGGDPLQGVMPRHDLDPAGIFIISR